MKIRTLCATTLSAVLLNMSGIAMAANPGSEMPMPGRTPSMGADAPTNWSSQMQYMRQGGMMAGGMGGMMGGCPMMAPGGGANAKVMMQMHGEMMRAMGDIMIKYADKFEAPPAAQ